MTSSKLAGLARQVGKLESQMHASGMNLPVWMAVPDVKDTVVSILSKLIKTRWPGRTLDDVEMPADIELALTPTMREMLEIGNAHGAITCGYDRVLQWEREYGPETPITTEEA